MCSVYPVGYDTVLPVSRFVKDSVLWACLAGLSVAAKQLDTAEVAYANIQVDS